MTTPARVLEVAEQVRAAGEIYREPSGYVSVQEAAPYDAASGNHRFPRGVWVEHCGIGTAYILAKAGLQWGTQIPTEIQYSPSLAVQLLSDGYVQGFTPGSIGVIDWAGAGWGATWAADHVVLNIRDEGSTVLTLECNTTTDGRLYYYRRSKHLYVASAAPKYSSAPVVPDVDARRTAGFATTV